MKIIVADIGGTSCRFSCSEDLSNIYVFPTQSIGSFDELLEKLEDSDFPLSLSSADVVVFAVAGPVFGGKYCNPPNIDWSVNLKESARRFNISSAFLINDFLAQAWALKTPLKSNAHLLLDGQAVADSVVGVVGAGTGFGKAALLPGQASGVASEGGHGSLPIVGRGDFEFLCFAQSELGSDDVRIDDVVSGRGLELMHRFISGETARAKEISDRLDKLPELVEMFGALFGRVCRNFALEVLSVGGLYIAGGVASKNPQLASNRAFERAFRSSEAHSDLLARIPVYLFSTEESGLAGARQYGVEKLSELGH